MTEFWNLLRIFRQKCNDPDYPGRRLSQARLGELLGRELDIHGGYSGAAVSDWERGKSKIHADQRSVLVSLIKILHELGGLCTVTEANNLLESGNYRALDSLEIQKISFKEPHYPSIKDPTSKSRGPHKLLQMISERIFSGFNDELQTLLAEAKAGPTPYWPRVFVAFLRRISDQWTASKMLRSIMWLWAWILTWLSITPSLRWPFANQEEARVVILVYIGGALVLPLLIGALTDTKNDIFWKKHNLATSPIIRLYTYQGAGVGFHIGYFGIFAINLVGYYFHLDSTIWLELIAMAIILLWGYIGARLVPYNLWRTYGRLDLTDGSIFFVFILLGPLWGYFFFEFSTVFLSSIVGGFVVLFAITLSILIATWQQYRRMLN